MQDQDWLIREMIKIQLCANNMSRENRFSLSSCEASYPLLEGKEDEVSLQ
jgi:hypothetical protein